MDFFKMLTIELVKTRIHKGFQRIENTCLIKKSLKAVNTQSILQFPAAVFIY